MSEPAVSDTNASSIGAGLVRLDLPCSGSLPPRPLQEHAVEREALCGDLVPGGATLALPPKAVWRYAWFEHRDVHLIASVLAESEASSACQHYAGAPKTHAARMQAHPNPLSVRVGLFAAVLDSSHVYWQSLRNPLCNGHSVPVAWPVRDAESWLWLQFCRLHVLVATAADGRPRSRRELGAIIAELDRRTNANTVRLRLLPRVEQECAAGDAWAAGIGHG